MCMQWLLSVIIYDATDIYSGYFLHLIIISPR